MIRSLQAFGHRYARQRGRGNRARLSGDERGAVFVEFLIAFLPVHIFFLCMIQSALIYSVRLLTEHAAINAARAAAVVIGDAGNRYAGEPLHVLQEGGERRRVVRGAALLTLAPLILNGMVQSVDVLFPAEDRPDGPGRNGAVRFAPINGESVSKVRVRVEVEAACRIGFANQIVCAGLLSFLSSNRQFNVLLPTRRVRAEAIYPYQGARYAY